MRLCRDTLGRLPATIQLPDYDRDACGVGIVHLGIGAFHRCHMAVYTDDVLARSGGDWKIVGVSLRSPTIRDQLNPQDGLYTVIIKSTNETSERVIGSVDSVLFAPEDPAAVIGLMAAADTRIISLTVTEKGYCHDPATGELNERHPDIVHDLDNADAPKTAVGLLVTALTARRAAGAGPVTLLCCDNLPSNGKVLSRLVHRFADLAQPGLSRWIGENVRFPSTMVDRIVPAMEQDDRDAFTERTGVEDAAVLQTEPFTQWVIEDEFAAGRPAWETAGATLVEDVAPYEDAKLRMLNGAHSTLAYLGYLADCEYVHQAMALPALRLCVARLMQSEAAPSIAVPEDMDLDQYRLELERRFNNAALAHRTCQIAMDGSQKLPQRLLGTVRYHLGNGGPISACSLGVAAWMRYVTGVDEHGRPIEVQDPLAARLKTLADGTDGSAAALADAFLGVREVFGSDLPQETRFREEVVRWLGELLDTGARKTVEKFAETT